MFTKKIHPSGAVFVGEDISGVRSVCFGVWVKTGSRFESDSNKGISHFLEHMSFKGTQKRTQQEIAFEIDSLGGDLNAFTSKESTVFYVKVLDEYLPKGMNLLFDILFNSSFPEDEIEKEKAIVSEEIKMVEDTPDDHVHDLFNEYVWGDNGLSYNILGSEETVNSFKRSDLLDYRTLHYRPDNIVFAVAGNTDPDMVYAIIDDLLPDKHNPPFNTAFEKPVFRSGMKIVERDHSEVHICHGVEGIPQNSPERYTMLLLNTIMGSGVSSRLFQEIRENRGLAYTVYSFVSSFKDTGLFGVYIGTSPSKYQTVLDIVNREFRNFKDTVKEDELERAKTHLRGNIILALESTSGRMNNMARQEIYYGRYHRPSEILSAIEKVSINDLKALADKLFSTETATVLLGPVSP